MKLRSIRLNNVRRFTQPVEITGFGPGLNVLSAPNEYGKSTLFDALHALFFFDAKSWKQKEAANLAPHAGGNPEVSAEIEVDGEVFSVSKTFTKTPGKGDATVHRAGHLFKQADEAELWIRDLIKSPKDGGPAGLLWVRQGLTTLQANKDDDTLTARRGLLSSVAGEIEEVTGGRQMEAIRAALKNDLERYVTKTGRISTNGPLGQAQQAVEELTETRTKLEGQVDSLRSKLGERRDLEAEKELLTDPETIKQQDDNLQAAEGTLEAAELHADKLTAAQARLRSAELALEGNKAQLKSLVDRISECDEASEELNKATAILKDLSEDLEDASEALQEAQSQESGARGDLNQSRETFDAVLGAEAIRQDVTRRKELTVRLDDAQTLTAQAANSRQDVEAAPSRAGMVDLEEAWQEFELLERAHKAAAAAITMECEPGQSNRVTLNDMPLKEGVRTALPDGGKIRIAGFGSILVHAAELGDTAELGAARDAFDLALDAMGRKSLDDARKAARQRDTAQENLDRFEAQLKVAAPNGVDALIAEIATLPEHEKEGPDLPSRSDAEVTVERAQKAHRAALVRLEGEQTAHSTILGKALVSREARDNAQTRLERANAAIESLETARKEVEELESAATELEKDLNDAAKALDDISANAPDLELAQAGAIRARGVVEQTRARLHEIDTALARLEALIDHEADLAIEAQLAEIEGRLDAAQKHEEDISRELEVLKRLDAALAVAQADAHDAYIGPIVQELRPLLRMVLPGAELKLDAETVLPTGLVRPEGEDSYDQLSGGTQEQIALLVRLAFARILANSGTPAPVILDDAIVYTDDDRIERMFNALTKQAGDLQIIVLSCRQKVFRGLGGQTLTIQQVAQKVTE